jgi:hypothetical protein
MNFKQRIGSQYNRKTLTTVSGLLALGLIFLSLYLFTKPSYFPSSAKKGIKFSLYYPVSPPSGLQVDRSSFKSPQSQVITFTVNRESTPKYYVSLEPVPQNFDSTVFQQNFIRINNFQTPVGNGLIGTLNNQLIGEVRTSDNTLVLINTADITTAAELKALCVSFQKIH